MKLLGVLFCLFGFIFCKLGYYDDMKKSALIPPYASPYAAAAAARLNPYASPFSPFSPYGPRF